MNICMRLLIACVFFSGGVLPLTQKQKLNRMLEVRAQRMGKQDDKYKKLKEIIEKVASREVAGKLVHIQQFSVTDQGGVASCGFHATYNMTRFMAGNTWPEGDLERAQDTCKKKLQEEYLEKNDKSRCDYWTILQKGEKRGRNPELRKQIFPLITKLAQDREPTLARLELLNSLDEEEIKTVIKVLLKKGLPSNVIIIDRGDILKIFLKEEVFDGCDAFLEAPERRGIIRNKFNDGEAVYFLVNTGAEGDEGYGHWLPFKFELKNGVIWVTTANSSNNIDVTDSSDIDRICTFLLKK